MKESKKSLRVKFFISNTPLLNWSSFLRKAVLAVYGGQTTFGLKHVGLILGTHIIDWNTSSLVIPHSVKSTNPHMAIDVASVNVEEQIETAQQLFKIMKVCVEYNVNHAYSQAKDNCQNFVFRIAEAAGFSLTFPSPLREVMEGLSKGEHPPQKYTAPWEIDGTPVFEWTTHAEFDTIVRKVFLRAFKELCKSTALSEAARIEEGAHAMQSHDTFKWHYALLKSYDRGYWLRHHNERYNLDPEDWSPTYTPLNPSDGGDGYKYDCPFHDPAVTGTYLKRA